MTECLEQGDLVVEDLRAARKLMFSLDQYEPYVGYVVPQPTLDRLVTAGIAEAGASCRPAVAQTGYRLTSRGWLLARRG